MKIEVNNKEQNTEIKFPCLMISDDSQCIVFVTKDEEGIVLIHPRLPIGHYSDAWVTNKMKPFNGTITLSND